MLITFIVTVAILAVLYVLINICNKIIHRPDYDFSTGATKSLLIFVHAAFLISFSVIASEIIIYFFSNNKSALWVVYGTFLFFAIFELAVLYGLYFTYEAIKGDEVCVRRFFTVKKIKISDIRSINKFGPLTFVFKNRYNESLFLVDTFTKGVNELIRIINEKNSDATSDESTEARIAQEKAVLTEIGREYRATYKQRRKKLIISFSLGGTAVLSGIALLMFAIGTGAVMIAVICVIGALALAFYLIVSIQGMKKELREDNVSLGNKHKFENKRVKGASKNKFKRICIFCVSLMLMGAAFMLPLLGILGHRPKNYAELTRVTGTLEYCREYGGTSSYIAIGLYDLPTEYRLTSVYLYEFDYSFFDDVEVGDTVTVFVDNDEARELSRKDDDKTQWNHIYYLATDDKEYFTYDDYVKSRERNNRSGFIIVWVGIAAIVAAAVTLISVYFVCKRRAKKEDIIIYK